MSGQTPDPNHEPPPSWGPPPDRAGDPHPPAPRTQPGRGPGPERGTPPPPRGSQTADRPGSDPSERPDHDPRPQPDTRRAGGPVGVDNRGHVERTRAGTTMAALVVAALLLILILVFIVQNSDSVTVHLFGWSGSVSLGVALLGAFITGLLVVAIPGSVRIWQLRRNVRVNAAAEPLLPLRKKRK